MATLRNPIGEEEDSSQDDGNNGDASGGFSDPAGGSTYWQGNPYPDNVSTQPVNPGPSVNPDPSPGPGPKIAVGNDAPSGGGGGGGGTSVDDIIAEYKKDFNRAPTDSELKSEQENLTKYGWDTGPDGGVQAQIQKRMNNTPGQDSQSSSKQSSQYGPSGITGFDPTTGQTTEPANDPFGDEIQAKLAEIIKNNGVLDPETEKLQLEGATEAANSARKSQVNNLEGELSSRGLLSEPGIQQGSQIGGLGRVEQNIAPAYASAVRDIKVANKQQANQNLISALGQGTNRQGVMSNIALQTLAQNTQWNEFLATYGLDRDRTMYELQQGQTDGITNIMQLFQQFLNTSSNGHV